MNALPLKLIDALREGYISQIPSEDTHYLIVVERESIRDPFMYFARAISSQAKMLGAMLCQHSLFFANFDMITGFHSAYGDRHLILVSASSHFFDDGTLKPWANRFFEKWDNKSIISPVPAKQWQSEAAVLVEHGFHTYTVLENTERNLQYQDLERLWERAEEPDPDLLRGYLGDDVFTWLGACLLCENADLSKILNLGKVLEISPSSCNLVRLITLIQLRRDFFFDGFVSAIMRSLSDDEIRRVQLAVYYTKAPLHRQRYASHVKHRISEGE